MTRSAIVRQHRDIGAVAFPLLILSALTGTLMVFPAASDALLSPLAKGGAKATSPVATGAIGPSTDWEAVMTRAGAVFPEALPRRLTLPDDADGPLVLRMKQAFEWTPNGRTYVYLDPVTAQVLATEDPAESGTAAAIAEKYYPVHAAKVGGLLWQLMLTFAGLALTLLGTLASWSFWFAKPAKSRREPLTPVVEAAE